MTNLHFIGQVYQKGVHTIPKTILDTGLVNTHLQVEIRERTVDVNGGLIKLVGILS